MDPLVTSDIKRFVGRKPDNRITFDASATALAKGCQFNDAIHRAFGTTTNGIPKGLYHFKSHAEANAQQDAAIAAKMAKRALERTDADRE